MTNELHAFSGKTSDRALRFKVYCEECGVVYAVLQSSESSATGLSFDTPPLQCHKGKLAVRPNREEPLDEALRAMGLLDFGREYEAILTIKAGLVVAATVKVF